MEWGFAPRARAPCDRASRLESRLFRGPDKPIDGLLQPEPIFEKSRSAQNSRVTPSVFLIPNS